MLTGGRRACGGRGAVIDGEGDSVVLGAGRGDDEVGRGSASTAGTSGSCAVPENDDGARTEMV